LFSSLSFAALDDGIYALIKTNKGEIIVELAYEKAPLTVINFIALSEGSKKSNKELGIPFYDGITFHRVIDNFMIQGGDPQGDGRGGPGYQFFDEFSDLKHDQPGVLSMANSGPNTNGSQFFITHVPTPHLDGKHSVFGLVAEGMSVVNSIEQGDIIESISIERIGDKANQFIANEESFNSRFALANEAIIAQKKLRQIDFENYANSIYPAANKNESGHFTLINKQGDGNQARVGQFVSVDISFKAHNGQVMRKPGSLMEWTLGSGQMLISVIDSNVMEMSIGESRTLIAPYEYFFGVTPSGNIPQDSFIIFDLVLISVEDN
jgi:peptidylprolyl isomerase